MSMTSELSASDVAMAHTGLSSFSSSSSAGGAIMDGVALAIATVDRGLSWTVTSSPPTSPISNEKSKT